MLYIYFVYCITVYLILYNSYLLLLLQHYCPVVIFIFCGNCRKDYRGERWIHQAHIRLPGDHPVRTGEADDEDLQKRREEGEETWETRRWRGDLWKRFSFWPQRAETAEVSTCLSLSVCLSVCLSLSLREQAPLHIRVWPVEKRKRAKAW